MIEEMRRFARRASCFSTKAESATEEQIKRTFNEQFLLVAGFQKEDIEKMNLEEMRNKEPRHGDKVGKPAFSDRIQPTGGATEKTALAFITLRVGCRVE